MTKKITLTNTQVADLAKQVVAEKGENYVYVDPVTYLRADEDPVDCLYVYDGKPQCLVGHVLAKAGVDLDAMDMEAPANELFDTLSPVLSLSTLAEEFLLGAQRQQDSGKAWGKAINSGDIDFVGIYATKEA